MKTLAALALATLTTLATACDPESSGSSSWEPRDGEIFIPPTTTTGGRLIVKGGHDNPWEIMVMPYREARYEYQLAFEKEVDKQTAEGFEADFLNDEHNYEICPAVCEGAGMPWHEGVYIANLRYEHGDVTTESDEKGNLYWSTEVDAVADVGCGCG